MATKVRYSNEKIGYEAVRQVTSVFYGIARVLFVFVKVFVFTVGIFGAYGIRYH